MRKSGETSHLSTIATGSLCRICIWLWERVKLNGLPAAWSVLEVNLKEKFSNCSGEGRESATTTAIAHHNQNRHQ